VERNNPPTAAQRLHLLNSTHIEQKIEQEPGLQEIFRSSGYPATAVTNLYLTILSCYPPGTTGHDRNVRSVPPESTAAKPRPISPGRLSTAQSSLSPSSGSLPARRAGYQRSPQLFQSAFAIRGNPIVDVSMAKPSYPCKAQRKASRPVSLGTLPAIPFEIEQSR